MQKRILSLLFSAIISISFLYAQNLYVAGNGAGAGIIVGQYDISTCTFCPEMEIPASLILSGNGDVVPLPNGQIVVCAQDFIYVFDPPNNVPLSTLNVPNILFAGAVLAPNGNVYLSGGDVVSGQNNSSLYEFNPVTNTLSLLGSFLPNTIVMDEIFYWNGVLYAFCIDFSNSPPSYNLVSIQFGNPLSATTIYSYPVLCGSSTATISSGSYAGIYTGAFDPSCGGTELFSFDLPGNSTTFECDIFPSGFAFGMGEIPPGFPAPNCACPTDAGSINPEALTNYCTNEAVTLTPNNDATLDNNDLLQYVLFSNPSDTAGSIIATSNAPNFTFAPPMQTGVTYYLAAMAGNNVAGNVSLSDPCLDFSNANPMVWQPLPTVVFSVANPNVCAGACTTVTATLTGTAPFTLSYTAPGSGTATQIFSGNSGTFQVCMVPLGLLLGISWYRRLN